jgi:hypothetical protein
VSSISSYAFQGCSGLLRLNSSSDGLFNVPSGVTAISDYSFSGCSAATEFAMSDSVESVGQYAFSGCPLVTKFNSASAAALAVPSSCASIGECAFQGMALVQTLTVPSTCESIGLGAFKGCGSLVTVSLPFCGASASAAYKEAVFGYAFGYASVSALTGSSASDSFVNSKYGSQPAGTVWQYSDSGSYSHSYYYYIPSTIRTVSITAQASVPTAAFNGCDFITSISVPGSVSSISSYAFQGCSGLLRLNSSSDGLFNVPAGVTAISDYSFSGCSAATEFAMSDSVESVGQYAFSGCPLVTKFNSASAAALAVPSSCASIGECAFQGMALVQTLTVPSTCESIGLGAFKGCGSLVTVSLPFCGASASAAYKEAVFGYAFGYASVSALTGSSASDSFVNSKYGSQPAGTVWQYSDSGSYSHSYYYYIPSTIRTVSITAQASVPTAAFNGCDFITSISVPGSVSSISSYAFQGCSGLLRLNSSSDGLFNVPAGVTAISDYSFSGCSAATEFAMSDSVESVGQYAFSGCPLVTKFNSASAAALAVPSSCASIGECAFQGMALVQTLTVPSTCESIGLGAFKGCGSLVTVSLPFCGASASAAYKEAVFGYAFGYASVSALTGSSASDSFVNSKYGSQPAGTVWQYSDSGSYSHSYYYYIPSTIRTVSITAQASVPTAAFNGCDFITSISVPGSVSSISSYAFQGCSGLLRLNSSSDGLFNVPAGVTAISDYSFSGCSAATEFAMSDSVESVGQYAFSGCPLVTKFNSASAAALAVPSSCASIGECAFQGMALVQTLTVPSTCESIGLGAFKGCGSLVTVSLPFCGASASAAYKEAVFGYAFGYASVSALTGSSASDSFVNSKYGSQPAGTVWQYSDSGSYSHSYYYYIPSTIRTVSITAQASVPTAAFNGCDFITNIHLLVEHPTIGDYAFQNCSATITYDVPLTEVQTVWDGTTIASSYQSGTGTSSDPYLIYYPSQFVYFIAQVNSGLSYADTYFKLCSNIDLNNKAINPMSVFAGHFIGDGRSVKNFTITGTANPLGLFCTLSGSVDGLAITGFTISGTYDTDASTMVVVGGLAGLCSGTITNCYAVGSITATNKYGITVGGLVGSLSGTATNCYANVSVSDTSTLNYAYAGGLAGKITGAATGSFAVGSVSAHGYVQSYSQNGGFVGDLDVTATLTDCYRSSAQSLTRFGVSNSYANELGTSATTADIVSWCKAHWSTSAWNFNATLPTLVRIANS